MKQKTETIVKQGDVINDTYTVQRFIGRGAFGEVYRVKHKFMGVQVIKILKEDYIANSDLDIVTKEARILANLTHKNIVRVFESNSFSIGGSSYFFITMGFVSGESLAQLMQRKISLSVPVSLSIQIAILEGLSEVHGNIPPIIHRDISPDNVLLSYDESPRALLSDFGLAQSVGQMSNISEAAGKYLYLAPECFWGVYLPTSDVFSSGIILYRMLTGAFPWNFDFDALDASDTDTVSDMIASGRNSDPSPPSFYNPECTPYLDSVVLKSINKDLELRYRNGQEFLTALTDESIDKLFLGIDASSASFLYS